MIRVFLIAGEASGDALGAALMAGLKALTPVEEFNEYFQASLSDERADTLGGLVMMELGRLPKGGEGIDLGRFHFQVLRADNRRIHLLEMTLQDQPETPTTAHTADT